MKHGLCLPRCSRHPGPLCNSSFLLHPDLALPLLRDEAPPPDPRQEGRQAGLREPGGQRLGREDQGRVRELVRKALPRITFQKPGGPSRDHRVRVSRWESPCLVEAN